MKMPRLRWFWLSQQAEVRLVRYVLIGALALLALSGAAWGVNAYLWSMPVDSYTVVETRPGGAVFASYSSHDAAFVNGLRAQINDSQTLSNGGQPACSGRIPYPPSDPRSDGVFHMTFLRGGVVIETVTGELNDCGLAQVRCGIFSDWKQVAPPPYSDKGR